MRVYLAESGAGWVETYVRKLADAELTQFLHPVSVDEVLGAFQTAMHLEARETTWEDVIEFLGTITGRSAKLIPEIVGVSFWGQAILFEQNEGAN